MGTERDLEVEVARLARVERLMQQLLAVTGQLAAARTRGEIGRIAIDRGLSAVGASYGALWLLDASRTRLELLASSNLPRGRVRDWNERWSSVPIELDAPLPQAVRTGEPLYLESLVEYEARFPASFARIRDTVSAPAPAYAMVPLPGIGALSATYERGEELDAGLRTFLEILAAQCGHALERVRAEDQERELSIEVTRAHEEILAVVSHDLRNPLGAMLVGASTLAQAPDARVSSVAERLTRQAERMSRLLDDLVDFSTIQAGRLALACERREPDAIVARAADLCRPLAEERDLRFTAVAEPGLPPVRCDAQRVVQALANLVASALKATPKRGEIAIGARVDEHVVFFVRDTGPGLPADEVPRVFDRHWRSKHATYKGAGLRLAIAKGIVDAHGGRIWAESAAGAGTTVSFTLT